LQATTERKEKEAARAAAEERQQQREKAREVKEAHFAPQKVSKREGMGLRRPDRQVMGRLRSYRLGFIVRHQL